MFFGLKTPTFPSRGSSSNVPDTSLVHAEERGDAGTDLLLDDHEEEQHYVDTPIASRARWTFMRFIKRIAPRCHYILPSFLHPRFYEHKKPRPTAWLGTLSTLMPCHNYPSQLPPLYCGFVLTSSSQMVSEAWQPSWLYSTTRVSSGSTGRCTRAGAQRPRPTAGSAS